MTPESSGARRLLVDERPLLNLGGGGNRPLLLPRPDGATAPPATASHKAGLPLHAVLLRALGCFLLAVASVASGASLLVFIVHSRENFSANVAFVLDAVALLCLAMCWCGLVAAFFTFMDVVEEL